LAFCKVHYRYNTWEGLGCIGKVEQQKGKKYKIRLKHGTPVNSPPTINIFLATRKKEKLAPSYRFGLALGRSGAFGCNLAWGY